MPAPAQAQPTTTTTPPTTAAPSTEAPTTLPPTTVAPTTAATSGPTAATLAPAPAGDSGSGVDWGAVGLVVGILLVVAAIIALIASAARKRAHEQGTLQRRIAHVVGGAQWVHDQASLDLIGSTQSPDRLRVAWDDTRRRMNDLGAEASAIAVDAHDQQAAGELRRLSQALGLLAGALDTSVGLRLNGGTDPATAAATDESFMTVNERRHELRAAIVPLTRRV
jgi:hypothetical protein